jgi:hypothetical protein
MKHVIVKADRGEPLERVAVRQLGRVVHIVHPDRIGELQKGAVGPIGFPVESVFQYDPELFNRLRSQWNERGSVDESLWDAVRPFTQAAIPTAVDR